MIYLKSLGVGALATVLYLVAVPAVWLGISLLVLRATTDPWGVKTTTIRASVVDVSVSLYLYLAVAVVIFGISFYWEFHRLAARRRSH